MRNFVELRLLATSPVNLLPHFYILRIRLLHLLRKRNWVYSFLRGRLLSGQDFMQHNTLSKHNQKLPFTRYDFGWVLLCIGMAIGAGTVLMPVQIGLKGIWVFITAAIIAYPATG